MTQPLDPIACAQALIRCESVTPVDGGALDTLQEMLGRLGFSCTRLPFQEDGSERVDNLYAERRGPAPNVCFAGHTDVVPVGDPADWSVPPFAGEVVDGALIGRGAVDMKGAIAAWVAAVSRIPLEAGTLSLLITGDEEGPSVNGTRKVLDWLADQGITLGCCVVGEPTSGVRLGDTVKIGRRGSLNATVTVYGTQGHTAYPQHADNPVHRLAAALNDLAYEPFDQGTEHFEPTGLQVTSVDVGNPATNVIPAQATAKLNVRFNDLWDSAAIERWIQERLDRHCPRNELSMRVSGESFLCAPGPLSDALVGACTEVLGAPPELGTGGGTSDARFIKDACPVAELGLKNATAHQVDEHTRVDELYRLTDVYEAALRRLLDGI
ncbi:succinyl-diaminopimelate desuccinylase [Rhodovibrio salinarum]|uniref:Succinyl-diaminopimelate desuccinylase n=1 Tax=Rhodovibrio salinarum TaxID=1087 RepID=A0A934QFM2_9PROT|nr:succinyl-diaminopimelate desuccinylase [Rhodovibrio salinarum]MBK1696081.1 succinyl-diaminopimelate desuccinylase [Rhodovibrio salinarum]